MRPPFDTAFGDGAPFSIGLEEELLLVDGESHALAHVGADVLARMDVPESSAGPEAYSAEVELRSPPSATAQEAAEELRGLRSLAREAGATLLGMGLHPSARARRRGDHRPRALPAARGEHARTRAADARVRAARAHRHARRRGGDQGPQRPARAPAATPGAVRQLALLVWRGLRAPERPLRAHPSLPAERRTAAAARHGGVGGGRERRGGGRADMWSTRRSRGTCAPTPASARSR